MSFSPDIFDGDIAICGTDSILGKALSKAFQSQGHKVVDIRDIHLHFTPPELARRLSDVKAVINLYGEPYVAKWSGRYEFDIYRSRLEALRALGIALRYTDPQPDVFLTLSNAMVYDQYDVHDEYSIEYGDSFMSEVGRMETEEAIKIERQSFSGRLVIARTGYIMSNDGGAFSVLSSLSKLGWGGRVNDGYQCLPMIHVDDAVRAILHILATNDAKGIFNLTILCIIRISIAVIKVTPIPMPTPLANPAKIFLINISFLFPNI